MAEMSERTTIISNLLKADNILILCHKNPDGDTIGSAGALGLALRGIGKKVAVLCSNTISDRYSYAEIELFDNQFVPAYIVAVDIATTQLLGPRTDKYTYDIDLCIDHHQSNTFYAKNTILDKKAAATCEIIYELIEAMGIAITPQIANCIYTGIVTDTGCFKFSNTTAKTHIITAKLMEIGADTAKLNELLFENKSRQRIATEQDALNNLEYHFDGSCAMTCLTKERIEEIGATLTDLEGITAIPPSIEGVVVGITIRQMPSDYYKVSVRAKGDIDASAICAKLGGGGHKGAAGCEIMGSLENVRHAVLEETGKALKKIPPTKSIIETE